MNDVCHIFHPRIVYKRVRPCAFQHLQRRLRLFNSDTNKRKSTWFQGPTMGKLTLLVLFSATFWLYGKNKRLMHCLHPVILEVPLLLSGSQISVLLVEEFCIINLLCFLFFVRFYTCKKMNSLRHVDCYCLASRTLPWECTHQERLSFEWKHLQFRFESLATKWFIFFRNHKQYH